MASVKELEAQLEAAKAEEASAAERPHRTLCEILHEFASVTGRHYLHEDIDALETENTGTADDSTPDTRKAPVTTGKEGTGNA